MGEVMWKPGDRVMRTGTVRDTSDGGVFVGVKWDGTDPPGQLLPAKHIHPLPPLLTPEAQAVLDAVTVWREEDPNVGACYLLKAHDAYIASVTPPQPSDPIAELVAAVRQQRECIVHSPEWAEAHHRVSRALIALEADAKEGGR